MLHMRILAMLAAFAWADPVSAVPAQGQPADRGEAAEPSADASEEAGGNIVINLDPDQDEEFATVELALQLGAAASHDDGKEVDLATVQSLGLTVAETDRQKAYVYLRIAEMQYERGNYDAAIDLLKKALPLADGDRSKDGLYYRILVSLLNAFAKTDQLNEARPYLDIYREIATAGVDPWERLSGSEDVIHKPSGIRLPHRLNRFARERLIVFGSEGRDAGAAYKVDGGRLPEMTVYVVAEFDPSAEEAFEEAMGYILSRFKGAKVLSRGPFTAETGKGPVDGFAGHVQVQMESLESGLGSDVYVFKRQGTLIKFRISFKERNRRKIEAAMRKIFKSFDWP